MEDDATEALTEAQDSDSPKSYEEILIEEIVQGLGELKRAPTGLFLSGLSAGLDLGFSVMLMAVLFSSFEGVLAEPYLDLLVANAYAVGFIFVVLGRSELFTEHTALAVFPVLDQRASFWALLRLWGIIYVANIIGASAFAAIVAFIGPELGFATPESFGKIASMLLGYEWWVVVASGMLAGWLMGLLSWLVSAAEDTLSRIVFVWLITTSIGIAHLHHSIAGTVEVLAGLLSGHDVTFSEFGFFLLWTTLGNAIGGVVFVAAVKYAHAVRASRGEAESPQRAG